MKKLSNLIYPILFLPILLFFYCSEDPLENPVRFYSWEESSPLEQGLDPAILENGFDDTKNKGYVNSILIVKNGYLVAERYFNGFNKSSSNNIRSVSKSFLSAMIGIALREGYLESLDQKMMDFFPEYSGNIADPKKFDITIKDLLEMRAGFENDHEAFEDVFNSNNWVEAMLNSPLVNHPGDKFVYSTGGTHLLAVILSRASGMSALEFGNKYLFEPLGIQIIDWVQDPQDNYFGGSDMFFTSRDMARFGLLYLRNGLIDKQQIVPQDWVDSSFEDHVNSSNSWGHLNDVGYGYLWWMGEINDYGIITALGHGGQYIMLFPEIDMIIVTTCNAYLDWDEADLHERGILQIISDFFLPAVIKK